MPLLGVENDTELRQSPSPPPPPLHEAPDVLADGLDICAVARPPMKTIVTAKTARAFTVRRNLAERMAPPGGRWRPALSARLALDGLVPHALCGLSSKNRINRCCGRWPPSDSLWKTPAADRRSA